MRIDIFYELNNIKEEEKKVINKSELARRMGCDRKTVEKYININSKIPSNRKMREYTSKLDDYKAIIIDKVDNFGSNSNAVYKFIQKKGFQGKYGIVKKFVKEHKEIEQKKVTIRFETSPGLQAQVDWKENFKLFNRRGEIFEINIFLMVLGYSRYKYLEVTTNRNQKTLFNCIINGFTMFKGVPKEILFDNMATVVDRSSSTYKTVILNDKFKQFAKDMGFAPVLCRAYRPQTKGKVEVVAKTLERLRVYNEEFDTFEEIENIVKEFNKELNEEKGLFNESIKERFKSEAEYLNQLPPNDLVSPFIAKQKDYKVNKESMIAFKGKKYSVPLHLINKYVTVDETIEHIQIYYNLELITKHQKSDKLLHYKHEHAKEILKADAMKNKTDQEISDFIDKKLKEMDAFLE